MLVKALRNMLEPKAAKVETTQDLRTKCLEKDICALLLKGSKQAPKFLKDAMQKLIVEYPKVSFAAIDSSVLYVKNLEEFLEEYDENTQQPRFVVFSKVSGSLDAGKDRLITSIAPMNDSSVSYGSMSNLIASVVSKKAAMNKIPSLPVVKTRTKKLVQEEKAKRQRKQDQERRKGDGAGAGSTLLATVDCENVDPSAEQTFTTTCSAGARTNTLTLSNSASANVAVYFYVDYSTDGGSSFQPGS